MEIDASPFGVGGLSAGGTALGSIWDGTLSQILVVVRSAGRHPVTDERLAAPVLVMREQAMLDLFHLLVPGRRPQTVMARPNSAASLSNSTPTAAASAVAAPHRR